MVGLHDISKPPHRDNTMGFRRDTVDFRGSMEVEVPTKKRFIIHIPPFKQNQTCRKCGASPNAWYVTLFAENPKRSMRMRMWFSGMVLGRGARHNTTLCGSSPEDGLGTQSVRLSILRL